MLTKGTRIVVNKKCDLQTIRGKKGTIVSIINKGFFTINLDNGESFNMYHSIFDKIEKYVHDEDI